ncbi:glycosyltransferase [Algoriphagus sp. D3-2-R+10]|uniref:glycosyltransferase n=1 Tax=Algoriphagus aurantiacus TaxID=3103948 RepID=UPI002B3D258E|nr:glycosyltransferase [Algoriphagus sp. D3-2-R+10]MEB2778307.1 glycosyltransferase [Algoriphagus sp. D3-2-R+10]
MRIIQLITRPQRRGAEIFAIQLSEHLLDLGHEVFIISILKGKGKLHFSGTLIQLDLPEQGKLDVSGFKRLAEKIKEIKPEIIQANAADTLRYAVGANFFSKKKYKLIYRNANQISNFIRNRAQLAFNQFLHSQVDAVISVSDKSKEDYLTLFSPKHITAIPIGIDSKEIELKLKESQENFIAEYILFVGSLVPEKDPLGMLTIFRELQNTNPELKLKFLGSGPLEDGLREKINSEVLGKSVEVISNQSNIFPILSKAKALVMPSKTEGLPGVILESMYCKVPVIAYGVGGIPEILKSGRTGWCIAPGDAITFRKAIEEVLNLPEDALERITTTAEELVLKDYQIDQIAKDFEGFYCRVIQ